MNLVFYGAGGFAREAAWLAEEQNGETAFWHIVGFIDDRPEYQNKILNRLPVMSLEEAARKASFFIAAVGDPQTREILTKKAMGAGLEAATLVDRSVRYSRTTSFGAGTVVCMGCVITTDIEIGRGVQINLNCTIGHDAVIEDFVTLSPGVHISGNVKIGRGAFLGTGAVVINGSESEQLVIGAGAVVGAQACVTRNVEAGSLVVGVPARTR